jgi:hypothetical protein
MEKYYFKDGFMEIHEIQISFNKGARLTALCYYQGGREKTMKYIDIIGEEYTNWLNDDNYIISLAGYKVGMGEMIEPIKSYNIATTDNIPSIPITNDNRSIHNEADVAKIQTLQEQLEEQQKKLKTITDLLINKGLV